MINKYYPILFDRYNNDQITDGFNEYYARYITACVAQGKGNLNELYIEYYSKTEDVYNYARRIYNNIFDIFRLENLGEEDYQFLHDEAYRLYEQAILEDVGRQSRYDVIYCIINISEAMDKEVNSEIIAEMKDYLEQHKEEYQ